MTTRIWTRHGSGEFEWWSFGAYSCRKSGGKWVLRRGTERLFSHEYLQEVAAYAEPLIVADSEKGGKRD